MTRLRCAAHHMALDDCPVCSVPPEPLGENPLPLPAMVCVGCEVNQALAGGVVCRACLDAEPKDPLVKRYKIGSCWVIVGSDTHGDFCVTRFADGLELIARPEPFDADKHTFSDPWTQCWTHELLHNVLAAANGLPFSPALRFAALKQNDLSWIGPPPMDAIRDEEWAVLSMQRIMSTYRALTRPEGTSA